MSKRTQLLHKLKHVYSHNTKLVLDVENKDIELIIEALEKQIAKKPVIWADGTEHCPYCEHDLTYISSEDEYCCRCGQKLDLNEVE